MRFKEYIIESASQTTVLQESLHCIGLGIIQIIKKNISESDLLNGDLFSESYDKYCNVDIGLQPLFEFANSNPSWVKSVVNNANTLKNSKFLKGIYKFYRTNGVMKDVYDTFKELSHKQGIKLNPDKWNPGDIWASKIKVMPEFNNLTEYNEFISKSLKKGDLIGISLKKSKGIPKLQYVEQTSNAKNVKFKGIKKPKSIFNTGISILTNDSNKSLNIRSFRISKAASITSEIIDKSSAARHGKKTLTEYIKQYKISQMSINDIKFYINNINYMNNIIISLWKDAGHTFPKDKIDKDWDTRLKKGENLIGYYRSIINSLQIGAFLNQNKGVANKILTDIFSEASSMGEYSSDFIKVS
jgi:hypothetical protein